MHISRRSKVGFSIFGALALLGALAALVVPSGLSTRAAARPGTVSFTGKAGTVHPYATSAGLPSGHVARTAQQQPGYVRQLTPHGNSAFSTPGNAATRRAGIPQVSSSTLLGSVTQGSILHNFDGLSDGDQATANGGTGHFEVTPPDQGLCVGFLGSDKVVWEIINDAAQAFTPGGVALTPPIALTSFFADPLAFSDPRCFYDPQTNSFFFTLISANGATLAQSAVDLVVLNAHGVARYRFDTSLGATCFGDQPHDGYDRNAFYISTDEFCGPPGFNNFEGAILYAISKSQLAAEGTANFVFFSTPLTLGGDQITTLEPAFGDDSGTEYLLNAFPFDQFGNNNSISNSLGFWTVTGDQHITSGSGTVTLTGKIIASETYAFPVPAASTGTGAVTCVPFAFKVDCGSSGIEVESEPFLNPDDSRMLQVQLVDDEAHGLRLYAALDSAVLVPGDPSDRDGAAWFVLDPAHARITDQGYVAVSGAYLLYPAILHTAEGTTAMAFTITSPTINPSAAYVVRKSTSGSFGAVHVVASGAGPHVSFAGPVFNRPRWGDYSAEELDPTGGIDIWSATEYIPAPARQDAVDNWGTRVWDVAGAS